MFRRVDPPRETSLRHRGFTLIELMIVVAIIALILAMAVPSLLASSKAAKETRAVGHLKMISTVNEQYSLRFRSYAPTVDDLVDSGILLHSRTAGVSGPDGYAYTYASTRYTFEVSAMPDDPGVTGDRYFFVDHTGVIRWSSTGPATVADPPIDG